MTRVANVKSGGTVISSFDYSYDAAGNPTGLVEATGDRVTWSYDGRYQLTRERRSGTNAYDITYTYDAVGNRMTKLTSGVTTTYSYDAANQLTVENAGGTRTTYSYDANGNVSTVNAAGSVTTYTWDGENRMATATLPGGAVTTFTYAANGLRRKTEVGGTTKVFVWDSQDVLLETDANGTTQATYTQTPDQYGALVAQRRSGASSFYHFDALGSTTELSNSGQTVTDTRRYYAFGETKASTGSTVNPFGYVGRLGYYSEAGLGLQYLRARWYKPRVGRFLSTDPISQTAGYQYVGGGPVGNVDPAGLQGIYTAQRTIQDNLDRWWHDPWTPISHWYVYNWWQATGGDYGVSVGGEANAQWGPASIGPSVDLRRGKKLPWTWVPSIGAGVGYGAKVALRLGFFVGNPHGKLSWAGSGFLGNYGAEVSACSTGFAAHFLYGLGEKVSFGPSYGFFPLTGADSDLAKLQAYLERMMSQIREAIDDRGAFP